MKQRTEIYTTDHRGGYTPQYRPRGSVAAADFGVISEQTPTIVPASQSIKVLESDPRRAALSIGNFSGADLFYSFGSDANTRSFKIADGVTKDFQSPVPTDTLYLYSAAGGNAVVNSGRR